MLVITGGTGFIGSALAWHFNELGVDEILIVDHWRTEEKWKNLVKRKFLTFLSPPDFLDSLAAGSIRPSFILHMGACSSTQEKDMDFLWKNNVAFSQELFRYSAEKNVPFLYASSAATYGNGDDGFDDDDDYTFKLQPLNQYGYSKVLFDRWVLRQDLKPKLWAGFRFFNVFGPNEYHKKGQSSVAFHAFEQIKNKNYLKLFKSYRPEVDHGEQKRDFIYVKDVCSVVGDFYQKPDPQRSGIFNLGTGEAQSFKTLGAAGFTALSIEPAQFDWIDMPDLLRPQYQYFTEARMDKLRKLGGYNKPFTSLEDSMADYYRNYLIKPDSYL